MILCDYFGQVLLSTGYSGFFAIIPQEYLIKKHHKSSVNKQRIRVNEQRYRAHYKQDDFYNLGNFLKSQNAGAFLIDAGQSLVYDKGYSIDAKRIRKRFDDI